MCNLRGEVVAGGAVARAAILLLILLPYALIAQHIFSASAPAEVEAEPQPVPKPPEGRTLFVSKAGPYYNISAAVKDARPGDRILIAQGVYRESVFIDKPWLTILGEDRESVILDGGGQLANGITAVNAYGITIGNLTVRNYAGTGVMIVRSDRWEMSNITSLNNRIYGLYAIASREGRMANDIARGSGDSGFYIGEVSNCNCVIERSLASGNTLGYSGTRAGGVIIRYSTFVNNSVGIGPNTLLPDIASLLLGRWRLPLYAYNHTIEGNYIAYNNNRTVKGVGISETYGVPIGTGIMLVGAFGNVIRNNTLVGHEKWAIAEWFFFYPPTGNVFLANRFAANGLDYWSDGTGLGDCSDGMGRGDVPPPCWLPSPLRLRLPNPLKELQLLFELGRPGSEATGAPYLLLAGLLAWGGAKRAGRPRRLMASLVDLLLAGDLYIIAASITLSSLFGLSGYASALDGLVSFTLLLAPLALALFAAIWIAYGLLAEVLSGSTAGKFLLGLRVVAKGGARPSRRRLVVANLARVLEALTLGLPSLFLILAVNASLGEALAGIRCVRR